MNEIVRSVGMACEKRKLDAFEIGDIVDVHVRIVEGDKERVQVFTGTVIARKGIKTRGDKLSGDVNASFTVRRVVQNTIGVERVFPLHSPRIAKIEVVRRGDARRAKLYYLRRRLGKSRRLRDQRRGLKHVRGQVQPATSDRAAAETGDADDAAPGQSDIL